MPRNTPTSIVINTGDAQKQLAALQEAVKKTSEVLDAARKSGDKEKQKEAKAQFEEAKKALVLYQRELRQTAIAAGNLNGLSFGELLKAQSELEASIKKLDRSSAEYKERMAQLQTVKSAIGEVREQMRQTRETTQQGTQAIAELEKQGKKLSDLPIASLKRLEKELTAEIAQSTKGSKEFIEANTKLADVRTQIASVKDEMKNLSDAQSKGTFLQQIGTGIKDFGKQLFHFPKSIGEAVMSGLSAIKNFTTQAIQDYKTFEEKSKNLTALTGLQGDDIAYLEKKARDLAATATDTAAEVIDAFTLMGSAKPELLKDKEALAETTEAALTLAAAAKMDAKTSVESLAAAMNQFGAPAAEADRYINALAAGSQAGSAGVDRIAKSIVKFGATAAGANLSVEESVGLIETLAEKGLQGEVAGTKLNGVLLNLQTAANQKFNPAVVGMQQALDNLAAANLSTAEKVQLFGKGNIVAGEILIQNRESFARLKEAVTGTNTAYEQAATNTDNLATKQKIAENTIQNVRIELGQKVMPIVAAFYEKLAQFTNYIAPVLDWFDPFFVFVKNAFHFITNLFSALKAGFEVLREKASGLFEGISNAFGLINKALSFVADKLDDFTHSMRSSLDVTKEYNKELAREQAQLDMLVSTIRESAEGSEARKAAIERLNKQYGKYLPNLLTEKSSLEEIEAAQKAANDALRYNIALKAQEDKLTAIQSEATEREFAQRQRLNEILHEAAGENADIARKELEAILNDPEGDKKLEAFQKKWRIDTGFFGAGLDGIVEKIRRIKREAVSDLASVKEAFAGMLADVPNGASTKLEVGSNNSSNLKPPTSNFYLENVEGTDENGNTVETTRLVARESAKANAKSAVWEEWRKRELLALKEHLLAEELTQEEYRQREQEVQLTYLIAKRAALEQEGQSTLDLDQQILDLKLTQQRDFREQNTKEWEESTQWAEALWAEATATLDADLQQQQALRDEARKKEKQKREQEAKEREAANAREVAEFKKKFEQMQQIGAQAGAQIAQFATDANFTAKQLGNNLATMALDALHMVVRQSIAAIFAQSMASAESVASWGIAGAAKAAALTALVEAAFYTAKRYLVPQHYEGRMEVGSNNRSNFKLPTSNLIDVVGAQDGRAYSVPYIGAIDGVQYISHPALISERGGEIIVDAARSRQIQMRYPWLLEQLRAVPQYAAGRMQEQREIGSNNSSNFALPTSSLSAAPTDLSELRAVLNNLDTVVTKLSEQLHDPLRAYLDREELFNTLNTRERIRK